MKCFVLGDAIPGVFRKNGVIASTMAITIPSFQRAPVRFQLHFARSNYPVWLVGYMFQMVDENTQVAIFLVFEARWVLSLEQRSVARLMRVVYVFTIYNISH